MVKKTKGPKTRMPKVTKLRQEQMDDFLAEIMASNISEKSAEFAKMLIHGNAWMARQLELGQLSIAKLRKLFQIQGSEKNPNRKPKNDPAASDNKGYGSSEEDTKGHGRNSADAYQDANIVDVLHPELNPGDTCPAEACDGRLYEVSEPGTFVHVTGAPLASATRYNMQKLRCAICEIIYTAPLPKGVGDKKYDAHFIAMLMINKYFMSVPLYRQDRLQNYLGIPLPASTQWDLMAAHEPMLKALYKALSLDTANGVALCYDDTSVKIMSEIKAAKLAEKGKISQHTCFTTGIVSLHEDHRTYLYITDNRTAGKCIAQLMALRDTDLDPPIMMCDALSANIPQGISEDLYTLCFCLVHARRQFYELPNGYDDVADKVIGLIGTIYDHEAHTKGYIPCVNEFSVFKLLLFSSWRCLKTRNRVDYYSLLNSAKTKKSSRLKSRKLIHARYSPEKRLAYHQEKSIPVMEELKAYLLKLRVFIFLKSIHSLIKLCQRNKPSICSN